MRALFLRSFYLSMTFSALKSSQVRRGIYWIGLGAVGVLTFHAISTLLLAVLGVAPRGENRTLLLALAGVLAISGAAVGIQSYCHGVEHNLAYRILGTISGGTSGAVLGFFVGGQLGDQKARWANAGLIIGALLLSSLAGWAYRHSATAETNAATSRASFWKIFLSSAIALISSLCAYCLAFGLSAWTLMALSVGQTGLAGPLSLAALLYLWFTRRAWILVAACLKQTS